MQTVIPRPHEWDGHDSIISFLFSDDSSKVSALQQSVSCFEMPFLPINITFTKHEMAKRIRFMIMNFAALQQGVWRACHAMGTPQRSPTPRTSAGSEKTMRSRTGATCSTRSKPRAAR